MSFQNEVPNSLLSTGEEFLLDLAHKEIEFLVNEMCHKDVTVGRIRKRTETRLKHIGENTNPGEIYHALLKKYNVEERNLRPIIRQRLWWLVEYYYNYATGIVR